MSGSFVVEIGRKVVGLAVRARSGFRFFASDDDFVLLDGKLARNAREVERIVKELDRQLKEKGSHKVRPEHKEEARPRSEEHTSEIQSLMSNTYAGFCLKKKKKKKTKAEISLRRAIDRHQYN